MANKAKVKKVRCGWCKKWTPSDELFLAIDDKKICETCAHNQCVVCQRYFNETKDEGVMVEGWFQDACTDCANSFCWKCSGCPSYYHPDEAEKSISEEYHSLKFCKDCSREDAIFAEEIAARKEEERQCVYQLELEAAGQLKLPF